MFLLIVGVVFLMFFERGCCKSMALLKAVGACSSGRRQVKSHCATISQVYGSSSLDSILFISKHTKKPIQKIPVYPKQGLL